MRIEDDIVIRIYLADDHAAMRNLLSTVVGFTKDMTLVGQSETGKDVAIGVQQGAPDVVLMDIRMPGIDGIEATKQIRKLGQSCKVVIYSACDDDHEVIRAFNAGADGYILKGSSVHEFLSAIREVTEHDGFWLDEKIRGRLSARCQLAMNVGV